MTLVRHGRIWKTSIAFGMTAVAAIAMPGVAVAQATSPPTPQTPASVAPPVTRTCRISNDQAYALTPEKPARVGGGAMYVGARERRYLEGLRGPAGQAITFKRLGSMQGPARAGSILDHWEVHYEGLAAPISIYLDAYHYGEPMAPVGFTCVPFTLGPPPVDGYLASEQLAALAIERGAARVPAPIPLDADGSTTHGVAFDRFRLMALSARAAAAAGKPLAADNPPRGFGNTGLMLVAYPLTCGDRVVRPTAIAVAPKQGPPVRQLNGPTTGAALATLLPGFAAPDGSIAVSVQLGALRPIDVVRIGYDGATCTGPGRDVDLPVTATAGKPVSVPQPPPPEGLGPPGEPVWLQVIVDHDGSLQQARYIGGPEQYVDAALAAARQWQAEPPRINGAPMTLETLIILTFR